MSKLAVVKEALASKDVKQLIDNFVSLSVLKIFNLMLPLVTLPYLIKTLGFEKYGAIVLALALMQYFQSITDYGFNLSATRDIARHRHSKKQLSYVYSKVMAAKLVLLVVSISLVLPIIFFMPQFKSDQAVFLLMIPVLIGHTLFPEWFFRGVERMRYITVLDLSIKLFFTAGVFIFIQNPEDYWVYPLLNGVGYCTVMLVAHYIVRNSFSVKGFLVGRRQIKITLKNSFPLFVNQFAPNLYNNTAGFLVGIVLGNYAAGVFGALRQIVSLLNVFNSVVSTVFFPYLNRNKDKFKLFSFTYLISFFILSVISIIIHKPIFELLGINDKQATQVFSVLVLGVNFIVVYSVFSTNYLIIYGYDKLVMRNTVFISILGFFISYPLIINFSLLGASIAIFISQFLMGITSFYYFNKFREIK